MLAISVADTGTRINDNRPRNFESRGQSDVERQGGSAGGRGLGGGNRRQRQEGTGTEQRHRQRQQHCRRHSPVALQFRAARPAVHDAADAQADTAGHPEGDAQRGLVPQIRPAPVPVREPPPTPQVAEHEQTDRRRTAQHDQQPQPHLLGRLAETDA